MNIVVFRKLWHRGKVRDADGQSILSALTTKAGTHCCLGFACLQAGVPLEKTVGKEYPENLGMEIPGLAETGRYVSSRRFDNTDFSDIAAGINDNFEIDDTERELQLHELARNHGHTFQFI